MSQVTLLRGQGWEVSDMGSDMPLDSFVKAAQQTPGLVAVGVSVTSAGCLEAAAALLAALRGGLAAGVYLAVGGLAVRDLEHAQALGADGWACSAHDFAEQLADRGSSASAAGAPA